VKVDQLDSYGRVIERHGTCNTQHAGLCFLFSIVGLNILLLLYGNLLVYQSRNLPTMYNEGKYIAFCVANNLQTTLFGLLLSLFIYDTPIAFFIIKWISLLVCDAGALLLIFVPKIILQRRMQMEANGSAVASSKGSTMGRGSIDSFGAMRVGPIENNPPPGVDANEELEHENGELRERVYQLQEESRELRQKLADAGQASSRSSHPTSREGDRKTISWARSMSRKSIELMMPSVASCASPGRAPSAARIA